MILAVLAGCGPTPGADQGDGSPSAESGAAQSEHQDAEPGTEPGEAGVRSVAVAYTEALRDNDMARACEYLQPDPDEDADECKKGMADFYGPVINAMGDKEWKARLSYYIDHVDEFSVEIDGETAEMKAKQENGDPETNFFKRVEGRWKVRFTDPESD